MQLTKILIISLAAIFLASLVPVVESVPFVPVVIGTSKAAFGWVGRRMAENAVKKAGKKAAKEALWPCEWDQLEMSAAD